MAINAAMNWWIRPSGNELNGGGYDSTVSGAGTNYADQDSPQLSLTDLVSTASTTITSATGGFTTAMIGNVLRLASATGSPVADAAGSRYLVITGRTDTNTITVDKTSGTYTLGIGRVGGAFALPRNLANGGTATQPALTSPLAPGHTTNVRGAGSGDPSGADYTVAGYYTFAAGTIATGIIKWVGYNGRPHISSDGEYAIADKHVYTHIKFSPSAGSATSLLSDSGGASSGTYLDDCIYDQNGQDVALCSSVGSMRNSWCKNTGSTSAGTVATVTNAQHGGWIHGNRFENQRGWAMSLYQLAGALHNIITGCRHTTKGAIEVGTVANTTSPITISVINNTLDGNLGDGIRLVDNGSAWSLVAYNNILSSNGRYGLNYPTNGDRFCGVRPDYNAFYNNTTAARNNISAASHDVTLSGAPYVGSGDYALNATAGAGAACKGVGLTGAMVGSSGTGYINIGAVA